MIFLGIDPGVSGGLACLNQRGRVLFARKMPDTPSDILTLLVSVNNEEEYLREGEARAMLEYVAAFAPAGFKMGATSAMTFGRNDGHLEMALIAAGIPYDRVAPIRWQNALGCRTHGDKNISKARAQSLFPRTSVTHAIADALLVAEFCRRVHAGVLTRSARGSTSGKAQSTEQGKGARPEGREREDQKGREAGGGQTARAASRAAAAPRRHAEEQEARSDLQVARRGSRASQRGQR